MSISIPRRIAEDLDLARKELEHAALRYAQLDSRSRVEYEEEPEEPTEGDPGNLVAKARRLLGEMLLDVVLPPGWSTQVSVERDEMRSFRSGGSVLRLVVMVNVPGNGAHGFDTLVRLTDGEWSTRHAEAEVWIRAAVGVLRLQMIGRYA